MQQLIFFFLQRHSVLTTLTERRSSFSQKLVAICNKLVLLPIKALNVYLIVAFNSGRDGHARVGSEFTLIKFPINWGTRMSQLVFIGMN